MKITKPAWVSHSRQHETKTLPIYCLHVHPDCSRIATGGLDAKVRIWSTLPILDEGVAAKEENPKLLCTLGTHNGAVLTVRWAHHGRYLASGSDDGVVLIWDLDPSGGGKVWGSDDVNVENWKALKRLVGHESDIADVAWSADDSMLASVGLDSTIFIWDGYTFEKLRKIDSHGGFVKGVCWDPIGEYLATQSDDKTVKIWNTDDWSCRATVDAPFKRSPGNTFFRRLSWSPDGSFIVASNAMNGPVFVAAVIERDDWLGQVSFVGHENTIQVAAFNPRLLFPPGVEQNRTNASSMVALGGDDNSISIWRNTRKAPLVVLKELFERQILDLCWADDGLSIYGCSSDGTICAIQFDPTELPDLADVDATTKIIEAQRQKLARPMTRRPLPPPLTPSSSLSLAPSQQLTNGFGAMPSEQVINQLTAKQKVTILPGGKRRIQPSLLASLSSTQIMNPGSMATSSASEGQARAGAFGLGNDQGAFESGLRRNDPPAPVGAIEGRTLGGDRPTEQAPPREIRPAFVAPPTSSTGAAGSSSIMLPIPVIQEKLVSKCEEDPNIWVEATNSENAHNQITMYNRGATQWLDFAPQHIVGLAISQHSVAAAFEDGSIACYSLNGDRRIANMRLDAVVSRLHIARYYLLAITAKGTLHVWDVRARKARFSPISIAHLLQAAPSSSSSPSISIDNAIARPNGTPLLQLSNGSAFAYDVGLGAWEEVSSVWWAESSSLAAAARAGTGIERPDSSRAFVASLEAVTGDAASKTNRSEISQAKPAYWDEAITLGHLETRIRACALLDSPDEYKSNLRTYAQKLADEGYSGKAENLIKELHGPVYFNAGNEQEWTPKVCGLRKRELLGEVLHVFARSRSLGELAHRWQDRLRDAEAEAESRSL